MRLFAIAAPTTTWSKPRLSSSRTSRTKCRQSFASAVPWVACARPFECASRPRNRRAKMNLEGKTALVTGASRGIGPHLAAALAGRGMNLVLAGRSAGELEAVAAEQRKLGVSVLAVATDLLDADARTLLVGACEREFGGVDVLVNNAGGDPLREDRVGLDPRCDFRGRPGPANAGRHEEAELGVHGPGRDGGQGASARNRS
ncbi:MAG: SDR family NAD(P)-dependent oxidoreductase [Chloroflexi bacterium]|nr:MAG: SDR family NAD(P)-dependent oxidoreductase [Chloroflexota bacterium]